MLKISCLAFAALIAIGCGSSDPPAAGTGGSGGAGGMSGDGGTGGMSGSGGMSGMGGDSGTGACIPGVTFNPGSDPNRNMVTAEQLCDRLAQVQCAAERCCCPDGNARKYESEAACVTSQTSICVGLFTEDVARASIAGFSASAAKTAFEEFERRASMCDLSITEWGTSSSGFASAIMGTRNSGDVCWTPATENTELEAAAAIASCGAVNACVGDGTILGFDPEWTCGPRRGAGGRCIVDPSCEDGLFCSNPPDPSANPPRYVLGTCAARQATGPNSNCANPIQCQSLFCVGGKCVEPSVEAAYCLKP